LSFRFSRSDDTVEAGVRRIAGAHVDRAIAAIDDAALSRDEIVHAVRQRCKKLRALVRLVRSGFPAYAPENEAIRDMGRMLAGARDAHVLVATLDTLCAGAQVPLDAQHLRLLRERLGRGEEGMEPPAAPLAACRARLLAARVRSANWFLTGDDGAMLAGGFEREWRLARKAMRRALDDRGGEASHEWRKRVKTHGQHLRLLRDVAKGRAGRPAGQADALGDLLGERHDLDLFTTRLTALALADGELATRERLLATARARTKALDEAAFRIGHRLFDERPGGMIARIGKGWRT